MKETTFVRNNADRWKDFESMLKSSKSQDPDHLAELFIQLTDDLSYARTFYPESRTVGYLNALAGRAHQAIYKRKRDKGERFARFWRSEVPLAFFEARRELLASLIIFLVAVLVGVVSTGFDPTFPRLILGDHYVDMTIENIESGDPMGVYKDHDRETMFSYVSINNIIRVSLTAFVAGAFLPILGPLFYLLRNGVMVGTFQFFFSTYGLFYTSAKTIWIHGTLEIASIIVVCGAGLTLSSGILFPGTYKRSQSFVRASYRGVKILVGVVPVMIVAALLEAYVTRYTDMPLALNLMIIGLSLTFVVGYYVIWPWIVGRAHESAKRLKSAIARG